VHQSCPGVAMDKIGDFVITWEDRRNYHVNMDIYAQRYSSNGTALGPNFKVNDDPRHKGKRLASVSMDRSGIFVITWLDCRYVPKRNIFAQRYLKDGTKLGQNFKVNEDQKDVFISSGPAIATNGNGDFVIIWSAGSSLQNNGNDHIYAQRYSFNGAASGNNFKVASLSSSNSSLYIRQSISTDENDNFIITWKDKRDENYDIYARRLTGDGAVLESDFKAGDTESKINEYNHFVPTSPSIATYGNGNFFIWWEDYRNSEDDVYQKYDIYAQRFSGDGTAIGGNFRISENKWSH